MLHLQTNYHHMCQRLQGFELLQTWSRSVARMAVDAQSN